MAQPRQRLVRRVERDLQAVGALAQSILDSDDADALLGKIADEAQRLVKAKATMVVTVGGDPELVTIRSMVGVAGGPLEVGSTRPLADSPVTEVVRSGTIVVRRGTEQVSASARAMMEAYKIGPVVAVPISSEGVTRGVLFVGRATDEPPFRQPDIQLVATFAHQAASAIQLSELRAAEAGLTVGAERDRIARDLHDGVVQSLYGLGMGLRASVAEAPEAPLAAIVNEVLNRLDDVISTVRDYIADLEGMISSSPWPPAQRSRPAGPSMPTNGNHLPSDVIRALGSLAEASLANEDLDSVLSRLVGNVVALTQATFCSLDTLTDDGTALEVHVAAGPVTPGRQERNVVPLHEAIAAEAIRRGRPVVVRTPDQADPRLRETLRRMSCGPVVVVPLSVRGRAFGGLAVGRSPDSRPFSRAETRIIEAHAVQAAIALEFARVREELRRAVVIEERRRVGIDLHDRVIQMLFGIGLTLQSHEGAARDAGTRAMLRSAVDSIDRAIRDLRRYVFDQGPSLAVDRRLDDELRALAADLVADTTLKLTIDIDPAVPGMVTDPAGAILHVAREAVSNVVRHAGADHCTVRLVAKPGRLVLEVVDDGIGLPARPSISGRGLRNMRTRAAAIGGRLEVRSNKPRGTVVQLTVPIAEPNASRLDPNDK